MPHPTLAKFQIGKNGLTDGTIESLSLALKYHKQVRISVLKSACRNREELKKIAEELQEKLPIKNHRVIGYTIILIK
ncbi:MAG: YhbY family RNA-binding protein [Nanoarchaeota archaeon]